MIIHNTTGQLANKEDIELIRLCHYERERLKEKLKDNLKEQEKIRQEIRELGITKLCKKFDIPYVTMKKIMEKFG